MPFGRHRHLGRHHPGVQRGYPFADLQQPRVENAFQRASSTLTSNNPSVSSLPITRPLPHGQVRASTSLHRASPRACRHTAPHTTAASASRSRQRPSRHDLVPEADWIAALASLRGTTLHRRTGSSSRLKFMPAVRASRLKQPIDYSPRTSRSSRPVRNLATRV